MPGFLAALLLFASCVPAHSKLLRAPVLRWEVQLPSPMRRGNAVVYVGSERLAATTSDGSLHVLNATDGSFLFTFSLQDEEVLTCETGVSLWKDRYAVYAVYRPISDTSTVIAVDMDTGSERWLALLAGRVAGTPMAGSNAIFVPHNIQEREGRVSVITSNDEENARIYKSFPEDRVIRVVGPGAVHTVDGRDVFVFAQSRNGGYSPSGFLYMLYQEINAGVAEEEDIINATNRTTAPFRYTMKTVSSGLRSSVSRPALSANLDVALTQQGSTLSAWAGSRDLSTLFYGDDDTMLPRWEKLLDTSNTNGDAPIIASPVISENGGKVLSASADRDLYCFNTEDGNLLWAARGRSQVFASPVLVEVPDERHNAAYFMEGSGVLHQFRYNDSRDPVHWSTNCLDFDFTCGGRVEADFAVSTDGNFLYYGKEDGRLISIEVASFMTEAPSQSQTVQPTLSPSQSPVSTETPSSLPSAPPSMRTDESSSPSLVALSEIPTDAEVDTPVEGETNSPNGDDSINSPSGAPQLTSEIPSELHDIDNSVSDIVDRPVDSASGISIDDHRNVLYIVAALVFMLLGISCAVFYGCRRSHKRTAEAQEKMGPAVVRQYIDDDEWKEPGHLQEEHGYDKATVNISATTNDSGSETLEECASSHHHDAEMGTAGLHSSFEDEQRDREPSKQSAPAKVQTEQTESSAVPSVEVGVDDEPGHLESGRVFDDEPGRLESRRGRDLARQSPPDASMRAVSPALSDMLSVDDSLYYDESILSIPKPGIAGNREAPDDESSFMSGLGKYIAPSKHRVKNFSKNLSHAGVSVRQTRVGAFSKRETTNVMHESLTERSKDHLDATVPRRESRPPPQSRVTPRGVSPPNKMDAWSSFLNELSKAEASFFEPTRGSSVRSASPPPPPPNTTAPN